MNIRRKIKRPAITAAIVAAATVLFPGKLLSQEFRHEIGAASGASVYMGDANKKRFFLNPGMAGGGMYRYNINYRWAIKANLLAGNVSGNTKNSGDAFPYGRQTSFSRTFVDAGLQAEFNFFPYGDTYAYLGAKPYTPYVFVGAGATYATGNSVFFNANIPFGIGFKYKVKNRMNIGMEFSVRKLLGDDFDVTEKNADWSLDAPYGIKSSPLKNKDRYLLTMIFFTWEFGIREEPCGGM